MADVVRSFFADPDWAEVRRQPKDDSPGSMYGGSMCKAINAACDGRLMQADSGGYRIGFDFTQIPLRDSLLWACLHQVRRTRHMLHNKHRQVESLAESPSIALSCLILNSLNVYACLSLYFTHYARHVSIAYNGLTIASMQGKLTLQWLGLAREQQGEAGEL